MRDLVEQLVQDIAAGRRVIYCRLTETRGSTPQKAGAMMLVYADGSQAGTLGGGCVEAEVKRKALAALAGGAAEIAKFQLDSDYGWDDGLICGGRMQILIDPLTDEGCREYFETFARMLRAGQGAQEVAIFESSETSLVPGAMWLLDDDNRVVASLRAPRDLPDMVAANARSVGQRPRPYAAHGIAYLPVLPRCRLMIVGGGHVGRAVGDLATTLDFDVWVIDDREEFVTRERFPAAERRIAGDIERVLPELEITPDTYCLIVTRGHNHDERALFHLVDRGARYVGLIGSRRKIKLIFDDLLSEGISAEALSRVYAPVGLDIGSQTVPEIAVSICAELISHRNRQGVIPGRPESVPVG